MTTGVLLAFSDGRKEIVDETHIHGFRDGQLLIATGDPGAGLDAQVVRAVSVADLAFAETCERDDTPEDESSGGSGSTMTLPDH